MYFYWINNEETNLTKFGITKDLDRRLDEIERNTGCGIFVIGYGFGESKEIELFESLMLRIVKRFKTSGEWCKIEDDEYAINKLYNLFMAFFSIPKNSNILGGYGPYQKIITHGPNMFHVHNFLHTYKREIFE